MLVGGLVLFAASCGSGEDAEGPRALPASGGSGGSVETGQAQYPDCDFVFVGIGSVGNWEGYFFTELTQGSSIQPADFTGSNLCASGVLGPSFEAWAGVGWNIAEEIHPDTWEGGEIHAIMPGGAGLEVKVQNNTGNDLIALLRTDEFGSKRFCAPIPESGEAIIPWGDFTTQGCGAMSGPEGVGGSGPEVYDPQIPIAQVLIAVQAASDSVPAVFDFCVNTLGPA